MKFLGKVFLLMVFAAVVSVGYYVQVLKQPLPFFPTHIPQPPKNEASTFTYKNDQNLFEVKYSKLYQLSTQNFQPNYFKTGGQSLASISIPQSAYPKTNFGSASTGFAVKEKSTAVDCSTYITSASTTKKMTKSITLNSRQFFTDEFSGAAAGTKYDTKLYRILRDSTCYEINLTAGIANIGNFEQGAVTELTLADVMPRLEAIAGTFNFVTAITTDSTEATGTLQGHVNIGPNCPVERPGQPCAPSQDAYDLTQIIVYTSDRSKIVTKANLDGKGDYSTDIPAGVYYVTYNSVNNLIQPTFKKNTIPSHQ